MENELSRNMVTVKSCRIKEAATTGQWRITHKQYIESAHTYTPKINTKEIDCPIQPFIYLFPLPKQHQMPAARVS